MSETNVEELNKSEADKELIPPQRILVLDTETSGLSNDDRLVEIAWYEIDEHLNIIGSFESLVDPERPINPSASAAHHLTNKDVQHSPTEHELFKEILKDESFKNVWLIAHNASFDKRFISRWMDVTKVLCTMRASRKILTDMENYQMQTLRYTLELDGGDGDAHRALADVHVLYNLLKHLVESVGSLDALYEHVEKPMEITHMTFGKHKGLKLKMLPKKYVSWLLELDNLDEDLRLCLGKL